MPSIFISYRRGPTSDITYRIRDEIARALGSDRVFIDIDSIGPGEPFKHAIERTLSTCEVVLAIVGPDWCSARLAEADDVLRRELEIALAKPGTLVLPVLVHGATLPPMNSVPETLKPLLERQAIAIASGADFKVHVARLLGVVRPKRAGLSRLLTRGTAAALLGVALLTGLAAWYWKGSVSPPDETPTTGPSASSEKQPMVDESGSNGAGDSDDGLASITGPRVHLGSSGEPVQQLQAALAQLGYVGTARDGQFGPTTKDAVEKFQKGHGLVPDGIAGPRVVQAVIAELRKQGGKGIQQADALSRAFAPSAPP